MRLLYDARLATRGLGISTFVVQLAQALIASGDVELIWLGDPAVAPVGARTSVRTDRRPYPLLDGPAGRAFARRTGADLIHFTANTGWQHPGAIPSVLTLHDLIFLDSGVRARALRQVAGHRYERRLVPRAAAAADLLVVPSHTVAAQVRTRLRLAREPRVVYEGVCGPHHGSMQADAGHLSDAVGAAQIPYVVAFAGRDPRKQTAEVVAAWRELAASPMRLHLFAAGGMPRGLRESLVPEVAAGFVEIHPHLPRERLWSLLKSALALIYPSSDEGFGLPVLEGMAAGIPVLSGVAPVTREIGGDAIVQLDPADVVQSIVAAVRRLRSDPDEAEAARVRGRRRVREFTWQATAAGYMAAYREAMAGHR
jgi:glycosyltransferase involved in cell wall biosynthesis